MEPKTMASRSIDTGSNVSIIAPHIEKFIIQHDFPTKYTLNPAAYTEEISGYPHKWNDRFHPSSDLDTPEMELYFQKHPAFGPTFKRSPFGVSSVIAMQIGTCIHAMFEAVLVQIGMTTKDECEVYFKEPTLGISGLCDVRRLHLPDGEDVLVDLKTCSKVPTKLDPLHALQVALYLDLVEGAPRKTGSVLYIEKSYPHKIVDFTVHKKDYELELELLYRKWTRVREAIKQNDPSLLECSCQSQGKGQDSCPIKEQCQAAGMIH